MASPAVRASGTKSGNEVATLAVSDFERPSPRLATANAIAMRWSPWLSIVPPRWRHLDADAVGQEFVAHAEAVEAFGHHREAIGFLHAQLPGAAQLRDAARGRRRDEQHRKLVDRERHERLRNADAAQLARAHDEIRARLAAAFTHIPDADVGAHQPQDVEHAGARRIDADAAQHERIPCREAARHEEERRR